MDTNNVYKLAVQAQLAAAVRELLRLELEENEGVHGLAVWVYSIDRVIDVHVQSGDGEEAYNL